MKYVIILMMAFAAMFSPSQAAAAGHGDGDAKIDPKEIIFEHLGDAYGWEVPFDHHHRIPLPVIVYAHDGLHCFSSSHITGGEAYTDGGATKCVSVGDSILMLLVDVLVSFIQAYVFTMLSTIFISLAQEEHHEEHKKGEGEGKEIAERIKDALV